MVIIYFIVHKMSENDGQQTLEVVLYLLMLVLFGK